MTDFGTLKERMLADPAVLREYRALAPEYALARQLIEARAAVELIRAARHPR